MVKIITLREALDIVLKEVDELNKMFVVYSGDHPVVCRLREAEFGDLVTSSVCINGHEENLSILYVTKKES